jgi:uncharacterized RDD family membrane protein YckC
LEIVLVVATLAIGWLVWAALVARAGQTPAKQLLHLRVIATDSLQPVGFGRMFWMRGVVGYLLYFVVAATLYILALMPFWDKRNQNVWDKVSDTYVVTDPDHLTRSD